MPKLPPGGQKCTPSWLSSLWLPHCLSPWLISKTPLYGCPAIFLCILKFFLLLFRTNNLTRLGESQSETSLCHRDCASKFPIDLWLLLAFMLWHYFLAFSQYKECLDCDTLFLKNTCQEKHCLNFNLPKESIIPTSFVTHSLQTGLPSSHFMIHSKEEEKATLGRTIQGNREIRTRFLVSHMGPWPSVILVFFLVLGWSNWPPCRVKYHQLGTQCDNLRHSPSLMGRSLSFLEDEQWKPELKMPTL